MKKAFAIMATVATVAATTMTAPAEARGIGPGLAFGLAAGALTAGAIAASRTLLLWAGLRLLRWSALLLRPWNLRLLRWSVLPASLLSAPLLSALVAEKSPEHCSGLFACSPELKA